MDQRELDEYYARQRDELQRKLVQTEEELKKIKAGSGLVSVEEPNALTRPRFPNGGRVGDRTVELTERKAVLGEGASAEVAAARPTLRRLCSAGKGRGVHCDSGDLSTFKQRERESLRQGYGDAHPAVVTARSQIAQLTRQKVELVSRYPSLAHMALSAARAGPMLPERTLRRPGAAQDFNRGVAGITSVLTNLEAEAARVAELEPKVNELERDGYPRHKPAFLLDDPPPGDGESGPRPRQHGQHERRRETNAADMTARSSRNC